MLNIKKQWMSLMELNKGNLYLTNNVEYIELLNEGHSSQAPRAFVQIGISRGMDKTGGWD